MADVIGAVIGFIGLLLACRVSEVAAGEVAEQGDQAMLAGRRQRRPRGSLMTLPGHATDACLATGTAPEAPWGRQSERSPAGSILWRYQYSGTRRVERLNVLLLIEMLATFISWLVGLAADRHGWAKRLQVNTERKRRVLSVVFVGRYLLTRPPPWLDEKVTVHGADTSAQAVNVVRS